MASPENTVKPASARQPSVVFDLPAGIVAG
jgi:hypothetical protein